MTIFDRSRHGEEQSDEAIQSFCCSHGLLRGACHRARIRATRWLAMTPKHTFAISRRGAPETLLYLPPKEGVGNAGCPLHPRSRVHLVVVERTRVTTSTPESPDVPARNGFNGLLRALPGDRALLPPSPCGVKVLSDPVEPNEPPQDLTPASRRQDHTTSPSATSAVVLRAANRSRRAIRPALRFARLTLLRPPHLIPRS